MERMRRVRNGTLIFYYLFTACAAVLCLRREATVYNGLLVLAAFLLPAVPQVLYRLCHLRPVYLLEIVFDGFVLAAVSFASLFGGYELIPCWDKILHFLSGFLFAVLGTAVYFAKKPGHALDPADAFNASLYTWMFAMMSAVLWEIWEYIVSFSGADPQQVVRTGVGDTMGDIIVCTVGGLITAISCWKYLRHIGQNRRKGLMMQLFEAYYRENIQNRP
ncbi:hypothetical protein [Agathobaculum sp. Marseille-P7918]|uniref:hypothetical protein n=1 Tax=Agathobaculum sp. Marseille-P7918 TaxID=2479843 RepID=UPI000F637EAB|nr:hypothetical protein [Agathobaculum sp. Marseille-P7918]